jgi:hypothetical protein
MRKSEIEAEILRLKKELSQIKKEYKSQSKKLDISKQKTALLQKEQKKRRRSEHRIEQKQKTVTISFEPIDGHSYSEFVVRLSTLLYCRVNCGLRSVVEIINVINEILDGNLGKTPSYTTIENWVKKCGLDVYRKAGVSFENTDYAQITDESMMIGSEKLLLTVAVPAKHQGRPLCFSDIRIVNVAVKESWNSENIANQLQIASNKVGHAPVYVISDNASVMGKGVKIAGFKHYHDISHSLGMFLERTYKDEDDFKTFLTLMTEPKFKYNMKKEIAYLLPPTQRTIARFMNLSEWVDWAKKMLNSYHKLTAYEREVFSFIPANASLIAELSEVMECIKYIEYTFKYFGLSKKTAEECQRKIRNTLLLGSTRMIKLGNDIIEFIKKEASLFDLQTTSHNNSSDIIESIFGTFKARKSPNKLYGITPFILFIPIHAKLMAKEEAKLFDFKTVLENIKLSDIDKWAKKNMSTNLVNKRTKCLKETA